MSNAVPSGLAEPSHVILYSGGMDSFITVCYVDELLQYDGGNRLLVYCGLHHSYEDQERAAIAATVQGDSVLWDTTLRGLGAVEREDAFIPARNGHLILAALKYLPRVARWGKVWLTVQQDEMAIPDRSEAFFEGMSNASSILIGYPVAVGTPWMNMDKTDMVEWYLANGYDSDVLLSTWSCYSSKSFIPCGNCAACIRRYIALQLNGLSEDYLEDPMTSTTAAIYRKRASQGGYSQKRRERILEVLGD